MEGRAGKRSGRAQSSSLVGPRLAEPELGVHFADADPHHSNPLRPRGPARDERHIPLANAEPLGEEGDELGVGGPINGRGGEANLDRAAEEAGDLGAARSRLNAKSDLHSSLGGANAHGSGTAPEVTPKAAGPS